jgi:hypothetical protein
MDDTDLESLELILPCAGASGDEVGGVATVVLHPPFHPSIVRYTATVSSNITHVEVDSLAADKYASTSLLARTFELSRIVELTTGRRDSPPSFASLLLLSQLGCMGHEGSTGLGGHVGVTAVHASRLVGISP